MLWWRRERRFMCLLKRFCSLKTVKTVIVRCGKKKRLIRTKTRTETTETTENCRCCETLIRLILAIGVVFSLSTLSCSVRDCSLGKLNETMENCQRKLGEMEMKTNEFRAESARVSTAISNFNGSVNEMCRHTCSIINSLSNMPEKQEPPIQTINSFLYYPAFSF